MACLLGFMEGSYKLMDIKGLFVGTKTLSRQNALDKHIESILTPKNHAETSHGIKQHAPVSGFDQATTLASKTNKTIDTIISIGGGSLIDAGKIISHRHHARHNKYLTHINIPATFSVAQCTVMAGFTTELGLKQGINDPNVAASYIMPDFGTSRQAQSEMELA